MTGTVQGAREGLRGFGGGWRGLGAGSGHGGAE